MDTATEGITLVKKNIDEALLNAGEREHVRKTRAFYFENGKASGWKITKGYFAWNVVFSGDKPFSENLLVQRTDFWNFPSVMYVRRGGG